MIVLEILFWGLVITIGEVLLLVVVTVLMGIKEGNLREILKGMWRGLRHPLSGKE